MRLRWWAAASIAIAIFLWWYPFPEGKLLQSVVAGTARTLLIASVIIAAFDMFGNSLGPYEFGKKEFLGRQWGRPLGPGRFSNFPFFGGVVTGDTRLRTIDADANITTRRFQQLPDGTTTIPNGEKRQARAGLRCDIEASVQYQLDPDESREKDGQIVALGVTQKAIDEGLQNAIRTKIAVFSGAVDGEELAANLASLREFVNAAIRCGKLPHLEHKKGECDVADCRFDDGGKIPASQLLEFNRTHFDWMRPIIERESRNKSPIEKQYGITIPGGGYEIKKLTFSAAAQADFEAAQRAQQRANAVLEKIAMAKKANEELKTTDPRVGVDLVETTMTEQTQRTVISAHGVSPDIATLANAITGRRP